MVIKSILNAKALFAFGLKIFVKKFELCLEPDVTS